MNPIEAIWDPDKLWLRLPDDFSPELTVENEEEIPLILLDDSQNKNSVIYNIVHHAISLSSLIQWINDFQPQRGEKIQLHQIGHQKYNITIVGRNHESQEGLYLGKLKDEYNRHESDRKFMLPLEDLVTHAFICGASGSGKTVLGKSIIEEAARYSTPSIIIDLKGDLSSLALLFPEITEKNLEPFLPIHKNPDARKISRMHEIETIKQKLELSGITDEDLAAYSEKVSTVIFTPKYGKGIKLAISSPLASPDRVETLPEDEILEMIDSFTQTFVKTLFAERKVSRLDKYKTFLQEIVRYAWKHAINLKGKHGLRVLQELIEEPPFDSIGGMNLSEFINQKMREELNARIAMCLSGVEQLWFDGVPLNIDMLLSRPSSEKHKTPISIINIAELSIDDQMHVVSHIAYSIYNWARPKGDSGGQPRILFFIDEIGGGGGKQAFYPSHPNDPPSKAALNILLRKGRSFGIGCIFATQNPGDIDYKGLSNCGTWAVSRLQTDRDRKKVQQGISITDVFIEDIGKKLQSLTFNNFMIKRKDGKVQFITERWLRSYHKTLSDEELARINKDEIIKYFEEKVTKKSD